MQLRFWKRWIDLFNAALADGVELSSPAMCSTVCLNDTEMVVPNRREKCEKQP